MAEKTQPGFREADREAGAILSARGNRLKLIEGFLFCATFFVFALLLRETCRQIAALPRMGKPAVISVTIVGDILYWACLLLVNGPLFAGVLQMAARMANEEEVFLPDLFSPFLSGRAYFRALVILWPLYWKFALFCWFPNVAFDFLRTLFGKTALLTAFGVGTLILLAAVWLLLALGGFVRLSFLLQWRMPLLAASRANRQIFRKSFAGGGLWWLCFLPRILLGFLTVGILLVADVIPRMLISYFRYAGRMTDYVFSSEEPNYE